MLTGFYRLGKFFASDHLQQKPDIICLSKALTGETMALGVTACTQYIADAFISDDKAHTFFHGHSFTANPLACTAALASMQLLSKKKCLRKIDKIVSHHKKFQKKLALYIENEIIKNIRQSGTIIEFELMDDQDDGYLNSVAQNFTPFCMKHGVYLRPLGNTIYVMPPYCIFKKELKKIYNTILEFLDVKTELLPSENTNGNRIHNNTPD